MEKKFLGARGQYYNFSPNVLYNLFKYQDGNKQNLNTPFQIYLLDSFTGDMIYKNKRIIHILSTKDKI